MSGAIQAAYLQRVVLATIAQERIEQAAERAYPHDIYRQTVLVTGIDPLHEMGAPNESGTAQER